METKTRILRIIAFVWACICTITLIVVGIWMSAVGDTLKSAHPIFAIHGAIFWFVAVLCYIAGAINGLFALFNFKIMIKSEKNIQC
jgi:uncharacterized membrane protein YhhN